MQQDPANLKRSFGRRLRALRTTKGLSQEALAESAGLDRTYISGCERGRRNVSLVNIHKLSQALGVRPEQLVSDSAALDPEQKG